MNKGTDGKRQGDEVKKERRGKSEKERGRDREKGQEKEIERGLISIYCRNRQIGI